jgi:hypothetical protein
MAQPPAFQSLDPDLFARAQRLLDDDWLARDAELAPVLPTVLARGVGQDWHKAGTFRHHLVGVARTLALWQQPREVRLLGLLHSVYGNAFVDLVKFDPARERARLQGCRGREPPSSWSTCSARMSRTQFVQKVLAGQIEADGTVVLDGPAPAGALRGGRLHHRQHGRHHASSGSAWQEDIYSRLSRTCSRCRRPCTGWRRCGRGRCVRPAGWYTAISRLGAALRHPALAGLLPAPPVFDHGRQTLDCQTKRPRRRCTGR